MDFHAPEFLLGRKGIDISTTPILQNENLRTTNEVQGLPNPECSLQSLIVHFQGYLFDLKEAIRVSSLQQV